MGAGPAAWGGARSMGRGPSQRACGGVKGGLGTLDFGDGGRYTYWAPWGQLPCRMGAIGFDVGTKGQSACWRLPVRLSTGTYQLRTTTAWLSLPNNS